jgi:hypothetical protein
VDVRPESRLWTEKAIHPIHKSIGFLEDQDCFENWSCVGDTPTHLAIGDEPAARAEAFGYVIVTAENEKK